MPLPTDGFKSRTFILGLGALALVLGLSFAAAMADKISGDQWIELLKWSIPSILVPVLGKMGMDKFAEAKAVGSRNGSEQ